jgi:hypothetical protein
LGRYGYESSLAGSLFLVSCLWCCPTAPVVFCMSLLRCICSVLHMIAAFGCFPIPALGDWLGLPERWLLVCCYRPSWVLYVGLLEWIASFSESLLLLPCLLCWCLLCWLTIVSHLHRNVQFATTMLLFASWVLMLPIYGCASWCWCCAFLCFS